MPDQDQARKILSVIDLTSLNDTDTSESIKQLCEKAITNCGSVAAVCVYPAFVEQVAKYFANTEVKIATVVNFPSATDSDESVVSAIHEAIRHGAQEIDVVFPYPRYLRGEKKEASDFIRACKQACGDNVLLKVILETGELKSPQLIAEVSEAAILAGADFLKTSTGKVPVGATRDAARVMLLTIKKLNRVVGFKASGGVRTLEQATDYIDLAEQIMGAGWVAPNTFRLGASQLLDAVMSALG